MNEKYGLYCVATLHPPLLDDRKDEFFTRAEKEAQIRAFYRENQRIPLCIDHCNADTPLFVVPARDRIGYVLDLFINRDGNMMVKFRLSNKHPAYKQIYDGITQRGEEWGVSVWIDRLQNRDSGQVSKKLTHVALTLDPRFAEYNTYTHKYALNENLINTYIAAQHYKCRDQKCFATKEFKRKLWDSAIATGVNMSQEHLQQPAFTDDSTMQVEPVVGGDNQQQQADQSAADQPANKKVRLDNQPTATGEVTPLREFDPSIDVNKLSAAEIKQQMEEILEHANKLGRTVDKLPVPEQRHYFKLINNLHERSEAASKHLDEMKAAGVYNNADLDIWIDMLKKNDMDPFFKNNIATFAAAGRRYAEDFAEKKNAVIAGERDTALKRAHDAEEELKTLREKSNAQPAMAMGKPVSSSFSQQISNSAAQPHHNPSEVKVAVTAYYNKFGDKDKANPFARAHSASTTTNSFAGALESAILSYGAAQNQPIVNQK